MSQFSEDPASGQPSAITPHQELSGIPQFTTAEYAGTEHCRICNRLLDAEFYRVNGQMACKICALQASEGQPTDSHAAFLRGLALGVVAAIVALAVYAGFTIVTHIYLGYLALGVGWFIAKAIMKGSNGLGGRHYQIAAALLTYASIALAEIPIALNHILKSPDVHIDLATLLIHFWPRLLWRGLASPFLDLQNAFHGIIGLFILFIGIRIAWTMTAAKPLAVDGPYSISPP